MPKIAERKKKKELAAKIPNAKQLERQKRLDRAKERIDREKEEKEKKEYEEKLKKINIYIKVTKTNNEIFQE